MGNFPGSKKIMQRFEKTIINLKLNSLGQYKKLAAILSL